MPARSRCRCLCKRSKSLYHKKKRIQKAKEKELKNTSEKSAKDSTKKSAKDSTAYQYSGHDRKDPELEDQQSVVEGGEFDASELDLEL